VLTTGGHNVGIVNPPGAAGPAVSYRLASHGHTSPHLSPEAWMEQAATQPGSWWPAWHGWLTQRSSPAAKPLPLGGIGRHRLSPLCPAPGTYVLQG